MTAMDDDSVKPAGRITTAMIAYAELYPSLLQRLRDLKDYGGPEVQQRLASLEQALASREDGRNARLQSQFGLTQAEARIALHLAAGGSIAGYAAAHDVSPATVRSQLKSIFAKTGAHRQGELIGLIGRV